MGEYLCPAIELHNIDCMDYLYNSKDNSFDLAIVDPPYFEGPNKSGYYGKGYSSLKVSRFYDYGTAENWDIPGTEYFEQLLRVAKNSIVWGANHFMQNIGDGSPCWIVWDKDNGRSSFADCELAFTTFKTAVRKFTFRWSGMLQGDMKNKEKRIHPTQKPVALYNWILKNYAKEGDRILDTHLGSGSSAIASHNNGFDFVGCEIDEKYFNMASKRFNNETRQGNLL